MTTTDWEEVSTLMNMQRLMVNVLGCDMLGDVHEEARALAAAAGLAVERRIAAAMRTVPE